MSRTYGYCRISTAKQSIDRQIRNIRKDYPDAIMVQETYTGTKVDGRAKFQRLLEEVRPGDTIVFDSVSRMSRNADEGFAQYRALYERGIDLVYIKEPQINTATYRQAKDKAIRLEARSGDPDADRLVSGILGAINGYILSLAERQIRLAFEQAQKEVDDLHQRTREGIETARLDGKQIGQQAGRKLHVKKAEAAKKIILVHAKAFGGSLSDVECIKLCGITENSYYNYKRELREAVQGDPSADNL